MNEGGVRKVSASPVMSTWWCTEPRLVRSSPGNSNWRGTH